MIQKPMLAGKVEDIYSLRYPVMVSPKLDGIRALVVNGEVLSRNFKPIANDCVRAVLKKLGVPNGLDGELMVEGAEFSGVSSGIMSEDGEPNFYYNVFDYLYGGVDEPFRSRLQWAKKVVEEIDSPWVRLVPHYLVKTPEELTELESHFLAQGYEGLMVRDPNGPYKFGRSSTNEGYLLKLKRFVDSEAVILGVECQQSNQNEAGEDAFGHTKRSHSQAGMVDVEALGRFLVRDVKSGVEFSVGTGRGLTAELRKELWRKRNSLVGKLIKYKSQSIGEKDAPRFPVWLGFRDPRDMGGD